MAVVAPGKPRARVLETSGGLVIEIPSKRNGFVLVFLPIWLAGWAFGWISAAQQVASGRGGLFLLVWLTFWTAGGAFAVLALCWQVAGRQLITLAAGEITVAHQLFGLRREQRYSLGHATNLRVSAEGYNPFDFRSGLRFWGYGGGPIAFDYGASTIRFGSSVEESEALALVRQLVERQPSFAKKSAT